MAEKLTTQRPPRSRRNLPSVCSGGQRPPTMRLRTSAAGAGPESLLRGLQALWRASERDWAAMAPQRPFRPFLAISLLAVDLFLPIAAAMAGTPSCLACISAILSRSSAPRCL